MKLILREEVENLGDIGDVVEVADGYGRNYLLPQGLAVRASSRNVKAVEHEKRLQSQRLEKRRGIAEEFSKKLGNLSLRVVRRVGEGDRLFGSVTSKDISDAIQDAGEKVDRRKLQLESPIKTLGVHKVSVRVHPKVTAELSVCVEAGETEVETEETVALENEGDEMRISEVTDEVVPEESAAEEEEKRENDTEEESS